MNAAPNSIAFRFRAETPSPADAGFLVPPFDFEIVLQPIPAGYAITVIHDRWRSARVGRVAEGQRAALFAALLEPIALPTELPDNAERFHAAVVERLRDRGITIVKDGGR